MNDWKHFCETCNFGCNYESTWNQHIETKKHNNNGTLIRQKKFCNNKCDKCYFEARHQESLLVHTLTKHSTSDDREKGFKFYCIDCDYGTFYENAYKSHCQTKKHLLIIKYKEDNNAKT